MSEQVKPNWTGTKDEAAAGYTEGRLDMLFRKKGGPWTDRLVPDLIGVPPEDIEVSFRHRLPAACSVCGAPSGSGHNIGFPCSSK